MTTPQETKASAAPGTPPLSQISGPNAQREVKIGQERQLSGYDITTLMRAVVERGASDLHLSVGMKPRLRLNGGFTEIGSKVLTSDDIVSLIKQMAKDHEQVELHAKGSVDFATSLEGAARFRVNAFDHHYGRAVVMRRLPEKIMTPEEIGLPVQLRELMQRPRGLILITGPTGSGKTTTLASLVNELVETTQKHIITLEQPIEYVFKHKQGIIHQREVPTHARSFTDGLKYALREDPDVIMVGEMRELETIKTALTAAETGHVVFATLHTTSAAKTVDRIIDAFPEDEKENVRVQLSTALLGVLCQQLATKADGKGLVAAYEFLLMSEGIGNLIREKKSFQIENAIQTGRKFGMRLLDEHLVELALAGTITREEAFSLSNRPEQVRQRLNLRGA